MDNVRQMIDKILEKKEMKPSGKNYIYKAFLKRHEHLTTKFSSQVKKQRILNSDPAILKKGLDKLGKTIKEFNILPENTYNMDEKAIIQGKAARVKVICMRGRRSPPLMKDGDGELTTIVEGIGGNNQVLPPMIVFKGQGQYRQWHQVLHPDHANSIFCHSEKGWSNQVLGVEYLEKVFEVHTKSTPSFLEAVSKKLPQPWRLLIFDGHNSHFTFEFVHFCNNHRIEIFCLPAHTTHILQPLDVGCFGPLQKYYGKGVETFLRNTGQVINKTNFLPILYEARRKAYTPENIKSAFAACGIIPFNPRVVLGRFSGTAAADTRITKIEVPVTPKKTKAQVTFQTPSNTRAIRHLQAEALQLIPHNDSALAEIVKKIANAAMGGFVDTLLAQTRADTLQKVLDNFAEARKNNPRSRNQITSGQAVTGRELLLMDLSHIKPPKPKRKPQQSQNKKAPAPLKKPAKGKARAIKAPPGKGRKKAAVVEVLDEDIGPVALEVVDDSVSEADTTSGHYSD